jgi:glycosyltransferase involved in cell wall biosynthesis
MKIAVVTRYFPSSAEPWQGRSAYQTLRVLARKADVRVFSPHAAYPSLLKPRSSGKETIDTRYSPPDVKASYYSFPSLPLISRPVNGWMVSRVLLPHVRAFAPDLIFSFILYPDAYAGLLIGKALRVPVAAMSIGSDINRIEDRITELHTRRVLRETDLLLTVSEDLRAKAVAMGAAAEKAHAVVNGCDLSVFRVRDRQQARKALGIDAAVEAVVYIGRMDARKGLRELVEAAAAIHERHPNLQVYMIGEGPDRSMVEAEIAAANVVTLPSYMEGCPNVVLEALACGRPVVATKVGGIPEIMPSGEGESCGQLVAPRDAAGLAEALDSVLASEWDTEAISARRGRSWENVADDLLELFKRLPGCATSR